MPSSSSLNLASMAMITNLLCYDVMRVVVDHLNIQEICNLDSSFCNMDDRQHWRSIISGYTIPSHKVIHLSNSVVHWLRTREVEILSASFSLSDDEELDEDHFSSFVL